MSGVVISSDRLRELEAHDPVLAFYRRVADRAVADPQWASDYRAAVYDALGVETRARLMDVLQPTSIRCCE